MSSAREVLYHAVRSGLRMRACSDCSTLLRSVPSVRAMPATDDRHAMPLLYTTFSAHLDRSIPC